MPIQWGQESCDRRKDPVSGARIVQLTSAAAISNNIYGEQPYTSPDGKRIIIARCQDFCWEKEGSLLVHELDTLRITMVVPRAIGVRGVFTSAWSGLMYYWTPDRRLMRLSLMSLEQEEVYREEDAALTLVGGSVSPDQRYIIGQDKRLTGPGAPTFQIVRLDLHKKIREVIYEDQEIANPHLQFNPITGRDILVQNNRGLRMEKDGSFVYRVTEEGTTLFVIDVDGKNKRPLPVGPPTTPGCTGHECFVGDTGRVMFSVSWQSPDWQHMLHDPRFPEGNILTAKPGDERPSVFRAPEHFFNHVCASRCGKYFVADSFIGGGVFDAKNNLRSVSLVIGNFQTGKYRTLVQDSMSSGGGNQCTHTHPYLTADNRYVIFNADPNYGIPQVYAAQIPAGFLESLN
jgi:hypothetical protein